MSRIVLCAALLLALGGCQKKSETTETPAADAPATQSAATDTASATASIADKAWTLIELGGTAIESAADTKAIFIKMGTEGTSLTGNTGCNQLTGMYMMSADTLVFAHVATTKIFCEAVAERETQFLAALEAAMTFHLRDGELELCNGGGAVIARFKEM